MIQYICGQGSITVFTLSIQTPQLHTIYLFWNLNKYNLLPDVVPKNHWMSGKQCGLWWDDMFCSISSGFKLFAQVYLSEYNKQNIYMISMRALISEDMDISYFCLLKTWNTMYPNYKLITKQSCIKWIKVNVPKFWTLYSILFSLFFAFCAVVS